MIATVVEIDLNANHNGKTYVKFVTQGAPYKGQVKPPREHKLFRPYKADLIAIVETLAVGDTVEYKTDDSQYKNMETLVKQGGPAVKDTAVSAPPKKTWGGGGSDDTSIRIARAVAVKAAVDLVNGGFGVVKKTEKPEILSESIINISRGLEKYLTLKDVDEQIQSSIEDINPVIGSDFDQEDFLP